jgi:monofunctional glycosyltransferase
VNVVGFGPGIYGAEAAAHHHFGIAAADLSRREAASLAAILPAPLVRRPEAMGRYISIIEHRMSQLGR